MKYKTKKTVHVIPHSHTDLGWKSTVEEYFDGAHLDFYVGSVNGMLTTVVQELEKNPNRTFSYAEMKFLMMWWERQSEEKKQSVRNLIKSGQLLIVNGGMSAPDEATTNYEDLIDNFMTGHRFIKEELHQEDMPHISWQIDTFGVSNGFARLARDLGFDAMFYSRLDFDQKAEMVKNGVYNKVWRPAVENFGA